MRKRAIALAGSALMIAGVAAGANPAQAQDRDRDRDRDRGGCSVELDQRGNSRQFDVEVNGPRSADTARVRLDFDRDRRRDTTRWISIDLDRSGDGDARVQAPRLTDEVTATVYIRNEGRRGGWTTCDATLDLDRRGPRA